MLEKLAALFRIKMRHVEEYVPREVRVAQRLQDNVISAETRGGLSPEEVTDAIAVVAELRQDTAAILNWPHEIEFHTGRSAPLVPRSRYWARLTAGVRR
jgi:hypothetical protein